MRLSKFAQPDSMPLLTLKLVAGAAFLILGILFIVEDKSWIDGLAIAGASSGWLFFVIRNHKRYQMNLESLR